MAHDPKSLADALLEQHVQHEMAALKGQQVREDLRRELSELYQLGGQVTLSRAVSPEQINGVIRRLVVDLELHGGIPELAAEMASKVVSAPVQKETRLKDILSREQAAEFVEQFLQMRHQRERLISEVLAHPVYQELVSNLVYYGLVNYLYEDNLISRKVPGVGSAMKFGKKWANKAVPGIDEQFEKRIKTWLNESLPSLLQRSEEFLQNALSDDELRDTIMAAWAGIEDRTLADLNDGLGDLELNEFVVLGYDFWLRFRETGFFQGCYEAVVEHLFDKYGDEALTDILLEIGVTEEVIAGELDTFVEPVLDLLREEGYMEAALRRRLEPFYHSVAAQKLLSGD